MKDQESAVIELNSNTDCSSDRQGQRDFGLLIFVCTEVNELL